MSFPKSGLVKCGSSSSSEGPNHFVIDLEEKANDHIPGPLNPFVKRGSRNAYEMRFTKNKIFLKIDLPGCSKLETFDVHLNKLRFTAKEEEGDAIGDMGMQYATRFYDGTILFKYHAYNNETISHKFNNGVLTITFATTN